MLCSVGYIMTPTAIFNRLVAAKTAAGVLQEERAGDVEVRIEKPNAAALDA